MQTGRLFNVEGMEFGIDKRAILVMRTGQIVSSNGIRLPDEQRFKELKGEGNKFPKKNENWGVHQKQMK